MAEQADIRGEPRLPLSRERVIRAALDLADAGGLESLSMRRVAQELGSGAMRLYNHVANKEDLLDGMVDVIFGEFELPPSAAGWKTGMRRRALSVREVLLSHRWAVGVMDSRTSPGPATRRHHGAVLGCLR